MANTYSLIVPVHLRAVLVPQDTPGKGLNVASLKAEFEKIVVDDNDDGHGGTYRPFLSSTALPDIVPQDKLALYPGVHLHWLLPPAFRHATIAEDGSTQYPAAPNRWLVNRICYSAQGKPSVYSWVVESDTLSETTSSSEGIEGLQTTVPKADKSKIYQSQLLGKKSLLSGWTETNPTAFENFSAIGYGAHDFGAFYQKSATVFGLFDDLKTVPIPKGTKKISYSVSGWFSEATNDPANPANKIDLKKDWWWNYTLPKDGSLSNSIYQGNLTGIAYPISVPAPTKAADVSDVVIANNYAEAMSTLLAKKNAANADQIETLLNAFQVGMADQLGTATGAKKIGEAQHNASFQKLDSHVLFTLKHKDKKTTTAIPRHLADDLNILNDCFFKFEKASQKRVAYGKQVFADWQQFQTAVYTPSELNKDAFNDFLHNYLNGSSDFKTDTWKDIQDELAKCELDCNIAYDAVSQAIKLTDLELVKIAGPRYYEPNPPVVLFNGPDANLPNFYKKPQGNPEQDLACRTTADVVKKLTVPSSVVNDSKTTSLSLTALSKGITLPTAYFKNCANATLLKNLFLEHLMLDSNAASFLTATMKAAGGTQNPAVINAGSVTKAIRTGQNNFLTAQSCTGVSFTGVAPLFYNTWSKQPWEPIGVYWEIYVYSPLARSNDSTTTLATDLLTKKNFDWSKDQLNLYLNSKAKSLKLVPDKDALFYSGFSIFTPKTYQNLNHVINNYLRFHPNSTNKTTLEALAKQWGDLPISAQKLDGFNEALLQKEKCLQLKVADPGNKKKHGLPWYGKTVNTVSDAVGQNAMEGINTGNPFAPIRCGYIQVNTLKIIDSFGQIRSVGTKKINFAQSLKNNSVDLPTDSQAFFPPRITQPSRLLFRWLSAADDGVEANAVPETSPIAGWLIPNFLDESLVFFQSDGTAVGAINNKGGFVASPGSSTPPGKTPIITSLNPHLLKVINFFKGHGDRLKDILASLSKTVVLPSSSKTDDSMAILTAHPLAIVRTGLQLDLKGFPAIDQSTSSLKNDISEKNTFTQRSQETGFGDVQFPVLLGKLESIDDGLMAYFKDGDKNGDILYALGMENNTPSSQSVKSPKWANVTVIPSPTTNQSNFTMLMDVRASIHATSGILPVKSIDIPSIYYQEAIQKMKLSILTAPVLVPNNPKAFEIPLPSELQTAWNWVKDDNNTWITSTKPLMDIGDSPVFNGKNPSIEEGWLQNSIDKKQTHS